MRPLLVLPCLLAVLLAACNGGGDEEAPTTAPSAEVTSPADTTPAPGDNGATAETPTPAPDPFANLQSYRYSMDLIGNNETQLTVKGTVEAPDSFALDFFLPGSEEAINSVIMIGDQAWITGVDGEWESVDIAEAQGGVSGLLPADFWGTFPMSEIIPLSNDLGQETINGIATKHYQIDKADAESISQLADVFGAADDGSLPETFSMDLWQAVDGGWPVKAAIEVTYPAGAELEQAEITWDVTDVNSSDISIQPPQ